MYSGVTIDATLKELIYAIGRPEKGHQSQWVFMDDDTTYMIYDYNEDLPIKPEETINWHIKAYGNEEAKSIKAEITKKINNLK